MNHKKGSRLISIFIYLFIFFVNSDSIKLFTWQKFYSGVSQLALTLMELLWRLLCRERVIDKMTRCQRQSVILPKGGGKTRGNWSEWLYFREPLRKLPFPAVLTDSLEGLNCHGTSTGQTFRFQIPCRVAEKKMTVTAKIWSKRSSIKKSLSLKDSHEVLKNLQMRRLAMQSRLTHYRVFIVQAGS